VLLLLLWHYPGVSGVTKLSCELYSLPFPAPGGASGS
jgi:hypothetical protein